MYIGDLFHFELLFKVRIIFGELPVSLGNTKSKISFIIIKIINKLEWVFYIFGYI